MNIHGWKQLAEWSIEHACLTPDEMVEGKRVFKQQWEEFCSWVVDTYGEEAKDLKGPKEL